MRYWGGARITVFNQYCFRLHPLLDHTLVRYIFDFSLTDKADGLLQKRVIAHFSPLVAKIRSAYEDAPLHPARTSLATQVMRKGKHLIKSVQRRLTRPPAAAKLSIFAYLDHYVKPIARIEEVCNIGPSALADQKAIGRYLTVAKTIDMFYEKVR